MIYKSKLTAKYAQVKFPDIISQLWAEKFETKEHIEVNIHFGENYDTFVVVPANKELSKDNLERIRILTSQK